MPCHGSGMSRRKMAYYDGRAKQKKGKGNIMMLPNVPDHTIGINKYVTGIPSFHYTNPNPRQFTPYQML